MSDLAGTRVLVTGAAGFLGANLTRELLRQGADVHALVRPSTSFWRIAEVVDELTLHRADLEDERLLARVVEAVRPGVIVHLAVRREDGNAQDRNATLRTNVLGTADLLEATASLDYRRFIHLGSSLEYRPMDAPHREDANPAPMTYYGASKAAATTLCQQAARAKGLPIVILRPFQIYGFWENTNRLIPTAIMAAERCQEMGLTAPGYRRDWLFVEDAVDAILRCIVADDVTGEVINIGSGEDWSNEEVVAVVGAVMGKEIAVRVGEHPVRPWDTERWVADITKARRLLGWAPRHSLREGVARSAAWMRDHAAAANPAAVRS
jgi:nucleoside-diphosphate-sugar epimerase